MMSCISKQSPVSSVRVQVYDPFPPENAKSKHVFTLNASELEELRGILPNLKNHDKKACDCGVAQFYVEFVDNKGGVTGGHFFHGTDSLRVFPADDDGGSISDAQELYDFFEKVISTRGYKLKTTKANKSQQTNR